MTLPWLYTALYIFLAEYFIVLVAGRKSSLAVVTNCHCKHFRKELIKELLSSLLYQICEKSQIWNIMEGWISALGVLHCWCKDLQLLQIHTIIITITPLLHMLYYMNWFGLEQEGGSLITPMALAHPLHPIDNWSRNRRRNLWVGWCVSSVFFIWVML